MGRIKFLAGLSFTIVAIASIATTSIIANIFHKNPALKESNRNSYNYIMMNLVLAVLFLIYGVVCMLLATGSDNMNNTMNEIMGGAGIIGVIIAATSIANCSIGMKLFTDQPDLVINNPNTYNYMIINLVLAASLMIASFLFIFNYFKSESEAAASVAKTFSFRQFK